jgi:decaprenylphospho-beta-D-ribofuranose 2-oxidase
MQYTSALLLTARAVAKGGKHMHTIASEGVTLGCFGGDSITTKVYRPRGEAALRQLLTQLNAREGTLIFRTGGMAFDMQSLNVDSVVILDPDNFGSLNFDWDAGTVTAGAAVCWGKIVDQAAEGGFVPYVTVSTRDASVAGTASADCLSRFSPTCGKEGAHILSLRLQLLDGSPALTCSRDQNPELFHACVAGMGYLGAVLEVTYRLLRLGYSGENIAVRTHYNTFEGLAGLVDELVPRVLDARRDCSRINAAEAVAIAAVLYLDHHRHSLVMTSTYVNEPNKRPDSLFRYKSLPNQLTQIGFIFPSLRNILWRFAFNVLFRDESHSIDHLDGYTFFQQGNVLLRDRARRWGIPLKIRQQTYVIPIIENESRQATRARLVGFLSAADSHLDAQGLVPALIDVVYLPRDHGEGFLMSSSRDMEGFAVTISFQGFRAGYIRRVEAALHHIAGVCAAHDGRVHLVKHVFASRAQLESMYPSFPAMDAMRTRCDPNGKLRSAFQDRLFPRN